jgi:hypothetical protein
MIELIDRTVEIGIGCMRALCLRMSLACVVCGMWVQSPRP